MKTDPPDTKGVLVWSKPKHAKSKSQLAQAEYELETPLEVGELYEAVRHEWHLHRYEFSGGGSGCRYWMYVRAKTLLPRLTSLQFDSPCKYG